MAERYLALDLGAESGRAVIGTLQDGRLSLREIHRFPHRILRLGSSLHWDFYGLWGHMVESLRRARAEGETLCSLGLDTWGVDFGLLDVHGHLIGLPYSYRDARTKGAPESFFARIPKEKVYRLTGIQILPLNTLYQLEAMRRDVPETLKAARRLLFMPDLFHRFLCGAEFSEFSFATTTQLLNPRKRDFDPELLFALGLSRELFAPMVEPGTVIGTLNEELGRETGLYGLPVVAVATHDTASAVAAVPALGEDWAYLSSGTWSLLGYEAPEPVITDASLAMNVTNEGGLAGSFRILKNITGLWLLQECRRVWERQGSVTDYAELVSQAEDAPPLQTLLDPDDPAFLAPADMTKTIRDYARESGQPIPESIGALTRAILESLALKYRYVLEQLETLRKRPFRVIHVIGGGSQNAALCRFTAQATGRTVLAGPVEATAIGNLLAQAMARGCVKSHAELRAIVRDSFELKTYAPQDDASWDQAYRRFLALNPK